MYGDVHCHPCHSVGPRLCGQPATLTRCLAYPRRQVAPAKVEEACAKAKAGHFQLACATAWEGKHGCACETGINHPNQVGARVMLGDLRGLGKQSPAAASVPSHVAASTWTCSNKVQKRACHPLCHAVLRGVAQGAGGAAGEPGWRRSGGSRTAAGAAQDAGGRAAQPPAAKRAWQQWAAAQQRAR